jgi:oxysterol-binding protein 1
MATTTSVPPLPSTKPNSIEESVRIFRLFEALRNGDTATISKAVRETSSTGEGDTRTSTSSVHPAPLEGTTILHLAIQCAEQQVIDYVISYADTTPGIFIDVNARDREGNTPLHIASQLGRSASVRLLLDQPNINDAILNNAGKLPVDLARTADIFQQLQLARSLLIDSTVKEAQALVAQGDYGGLTKLLEDSRVQNVLDVNGGELVTDPTTSHSGGTLLHEAARKKNATLIQVLLLHGADPFRRDRKGKLPQDVTKDEKTRSMLKRSPAAAVAQRGIQEKAVLGSASGSGGPIAPADSALGSKEAREMKGYLKKWTNYRTGYKLRWFVLEDGVLSYYKHQGTTLQKVDMTTILS